MRVEPCYSGYIESYDGVDDEWTWGDRQELSIFSLSAESDWEGEADFNAFVKFSFDRYYFYTYLSIMDDVEHNWNGTDDFPYNFNGVEWFFQLDTQTVPSTYTDNTVQIRFNRGEANFKSSTFREGITTADFKWYSSNTSTGWVLECGIPWTNVMPDGSLPEDFDEWITTYVGCSEYYGRLIGFDLHVSDSDGSDSLVGARGSGTQMAWDKDNPWDGDEEDSADGTEDLAWNHTNVFGYLDLEGGHYDCWEPDFLPDLPSEDAENNPQEFTLYPNPVNDQLFIHPSDPYRFLTLYTSIGERVGYHKINGPMIDVSSLQPGLYIAVFDGSRVVKFVKE